MLYFRSAISAVLLALLISPAQGELPSSASLPVLTLAESERLALEHHPLLLQSAAQIQAANARAMASDQLPDPQISLGLQNVPVDSFALDKDDTTMVTVGIAQMFPTLGSRGLKRQAADQSTVAVQAERQDIAARILRDTRRAWLEMFYLDKALEVNRTTYEISTQMVDAEQARYRSGASQQVTVLRSILERDELLVREKELLLQRQQVESTLLRLMSNDYPAFRVSEELPALPPPLSISRILDTLSRHPQVQIVDAQRRAADFDTARAKRNYFPEFGVAADYGYRAARDINDAQLPGMLSAKLVMSLPLFPLNRQDALVKETQALELGLRYQRDDVLRSLQQQVHSHYAAYDSLQQRVALIEQQLSRVEQTVQAGLTAFRNGRGDLPQVLSLLHERHAAALRKWRLQTDAVLASVELAYLSSSLGSTTFEESTHEPK